MSNQSYRTGRSPWRGPAAEHAEINAGPAAIFELIADPAEQPRWDGNDNRPATGQGVLYRHFSTRESIAPAVFEENIDGIEALAADPALTVEDLLAIVVEQIATSAVFIAMIHPTDTDDMRLFEVARARWRIRVAR
ncbi:hypothetical protein [Nocardia arthritidis]|uniref:hypothetical protein n=1 Tax=Nocardia arthritidis TaxID=228602 RepID=UPI0007A41E86|nr:hypothetical protein [Nocardia arthritidis]